MALGGEVVGEIGFAGAGAEAALAGQAVTFEQREWRRTALSVSPSWAASSETVRWAVQSNATILPRVVLKNRLCWSESVIRFLSTLKITQ